jgi:hypothetical protein
MKPIKQSASDAFDDAADWLAFDPGAEGVLRSARVTRAVEAAVDAVSAGRAIDIDALAAAIGGPRVVAEAFGSFIEWRIAPEAGRGLLQ